MPNNKRKTNSLSSATAWSHLCLLLNTGRHTQAALAEKTGLTIGTVVRWMRVLKSRQLVYIAGWYREGTIGQWAAQWSWGYRVADEPKPKAQTQAQYSRNYRISKQVKAFKSSLKEYFSASD